MAYGRDPDRHTRGAGAIAARDNAHPGAARARLIAKNRATVAHDRVMRTMTYGPRGGMSAMGAANLPGKGPVSLRPNTGLRPDVPGRVDPITGGTRPGYGGGATGGGTTTIRRPPMTGGRIVNAPPLTEMPSQMVDPIFPVVTADNGSDPVPPRPLPRPPSSSTGGAAGGGVVPPKTSPPPLPELDEVTVPDVPEGTSAVAGISTKTAVLVGAAALAAYFLLRKKRS